MNSQCGWISWMLKTMPLGTGPEIDNLKNPIKYVGCFFGTAGCTNIEFHCYSYITLDLDQLEATILVQYFSWNPAEPDRRTKLWVSIDWPCSNGIVWFSKSKPNCIKGCKFDIGFTMVYQVYMNFQSIYNKISKAPKIETWTSFVIVETALRESSKLTGITAEAEDGFSAEIVEVESPEKGLQESGSEYIECDDMLTWSHLFWFQVPKSFQKMCG